MLYRSIYVSIIHQTEALKITSWDLPCKVLHTLLPMYECSKRKLKTLRSL